MAREFDGGTGNRLVDTSGGYGLGTAHTIFAHLRPEATTGLGSAVAVGTNANTGHSWIGNNTNKFHFQIANTSSGIQSITSSVTYSTGTWYRVCGVSRTSTDRQLYVDAVSRGTNTSTATPGISSADRLALGTYVGNATVANIWIGAVAEVALWAVALSTSEINSLNNGISPLLVRPQSLRIYIPAFGTGVTNQPETSWGSVSATLTKASGTANVTTAPHPRIIYPRRRSDIWVPAVSSAAPSITALSAINITATSAQPRISYS